MWSFGASLAQPLFNGGLTGAQVEAARATYKSDVATYRQTVLTAIQQVEDNLAGIRILSREAKVQAENVRISRQATQIALNEYQAGTQAYTTVVTAEEQQLAVEELLLSTQAQIQTDAVNLIVALGGGWTQSKLPDAAADLRRRRPPRRRRSRRPPRGLRVRGRSGARCRRRGGRPRSGSARCWRRGRS